MSKYKENTEQLIKQFEEVLKQEDVTSEKLKNYLYSRGTDETPIKDLIINMQDIQTKKRQIHKKLRDISHDVH